MSKPSSSTCCTRVTTDFPTHNVLCGATLGPECAWGDQYVMGAPRYSPSGAHLA